MHVSQIANINKMRPSQRYWYFIRKIVDFEEVWTLKGDSGWLTVRDLTSGGLGAPFWPELDFALECAEGEWEGATPERIALGTFKEKWIPRLKNDGIFISVFPIQSGKTINRCPQKLLLDVKSEIRRYEYR
ncbi:DUF2750 domain-containing protein (plasmid) [Agrobacterium sp. rho-13.3]|uniref:DUF2750 domain-containing protein n=1 Tax=Agrobacterium sp. rho-13.3 TaxID=3072980 RepID=UPI002A16A5C5|nr:DUF2750 domain-containing protein [Agrobacterium sp. rho-13.3]MDX8310152.1 DUF2750 domain-containing protein [Agrobacterium sp. rho-13.3]